MKNVVVMSLNNQFIYADIATPAENNADLPFSQFSLGLSSHGNAFTRRCFHQKIFEMYQISFTGLYKFKVLNTKKYTDIFCRYTPRMTFLGVSSDSLLAPGVI
ncbi:hypothetical protein T4D_4487 [Trichinella pseudospiralis]|uniref:Uncharacterized protein n=1 Tax=Trichinella pseudospiralis TaxID=6337 RepID=A0A0V1FFW0_TRIPS|nr:hypothetical protein T4D_4487 [Trichinella pseudospiralis]